MALHINVRRNLDEIRHQQDMNIQLLANRGLSTHLDACRTLDGGPLVGVQGFERGVPPNMQTAATQAALVGAQHFRRTSNRDQVVPFRYGSHFRYGRLPQLDDGENWFFQNELRNIIPTMFRREFARINARTVLPVWFAADPTSRRVVWRQTEGYGQAAVMTDYGADAPTAEVEGLEADQPVRPIRIAAEWTIDEIRASRRVGRPLDVAKAEAARDAMLRTENRIIWTGDADHGIVGMNDDATTQITVQAATGTWASLTADQRLTDMHSVTNAVVENSGDVEEAGTMLMPTAAYHLTTVQRIGVDQNMTTLMHFQASTPYIRSVVRVREMAGIGAGSANRILVGDMDLSKMRMNVVLDLEQWPPDIRNGVTRVNYHMKTAGVTVHKPRAFRWLEGV